MPASVTSSTRSPGQQRLEQDRRPRGLVALEVGDDPAADRDAQVGGEPLEPAGVLGGDHVGARRAPRPAAAGRPSTRPIGVAASTSTPGLRSHAPIMSAGTVQLPIVTTTRRPETRERPVGLSRTADGDGRAVGAGAGRGAGSACEDPVVGWAASVGVALLALFLRLWNLGTPTRVRVRRDLLRQGRLVAAALRLRPRATSTAPTRRSSTAPDGPVEGRPVDDRPPRGRQVADRAGREGVRDGPVRLADRRGRRRLADGAGDVPAGPPADRLDRAGLRRRAAAELRRPAVRAVPAGAARHLPGVLHALRRSLPRRRPGLVPRPAGPAGARTRSPTPASGARCGRLLFRPVAAGRRRLLGAGARHQVEAVYPLRRSACWSGCGAPAPGARSASAGRCCGRCVADGVPAFVHLVLVGVRRLRRDLDRLAGARPRVREAPLRPRSTPSSPDSRHCKDDSPPTTSTTRRAGRPRASPTPAASARSSSRCGRCGTTTATSTRSTPTS